MATSLLALLDDITTVLDDVAVLTKVAAKKTAGVLGDDLALNAQQVAGVQTNRELPVVWAVAKGSLLNKAILVPAALAISAWAPWLITPLLMLGGAFLCFEGAEKLAHRFLHSRAEDAAAHAKLAEALVKADVDMAKLEADKIKGAVRTDFILSAEIIAITLGTVSAEPMLKQAGVLATVAVLITVAVYGLVAAIVKMDDLGLWLARRPGSGLSQALGRGLVAAAPQLMRLLTVLGTAAMFLVGGSILLHGIGPLHHLVQAWLAGFQGGSALLLSTLADGAVGLVAGALVLLGVTAVQRLRGAGQAPAH
jgi:predicted DNA repair protein MutK